MIRVWITPSGEISTAVVAVTRHSTAACHRPASTGRTPMMQAANQAQLGQVPPIGPTSGSETTAAAANPRTARRRATGLSHGVTRAYRTNPWAAENSRMPIAPSTIRTMSGSRPRPIAGMIRPVEALVASAMRVTIRARRICRRMRRCYSRAPHDRPGK
jgi:hypothetical protein